MTTSSKSAQALAIMASAARVRAFAEEERRRLDEAGVRSGWSVRASLHGIPPALVEEVDPHAKVRANDTKEWLSGDMLGGLLSSITFSVSSLPWDKPERLDWRERAGLAPSQHGEPDDSIRRDLEAERR